LKFKAEQGQPDATPQLLASSSIQLGRRLPWSEEVFSSDNSCRVIRLAIPALITASQIEGRPSRGETAQSVSPSTRGFPCPTNKCRRRSAAVPGSTAEVDQSQMIEPEGVPPGSRCRSMHGLDLFKNLRLAVRKTRNSPSSVIFQARH